MGACYFVKMDEGSGSVDMSGFDYASHKTFDERELLLLWIDFSFASVAIRFCVRDVRHFWRIGVWFCGGQFSLIFGCVGYKRSAEGRATLQKFIALQVCSELGYLVS